MLYFGKIKGSTKIEVRAFQMTAIMHIKQALEVLTGELVEIHHSSVEFGSEIRWKKDGYPTLLGRTLTFRGKFTSYPSCRHGEILADGELVKKEKSQAVTKWMARSLNLNVVDDNGSETRYTTEWLYSAGLYPKVRIGTTFGRRSWLEGRDRTERCIMPLDSEFKL